MRKLLLVFALLCPTPLIAAIATAAQWDVRTTGNDANGGGFVNTVAIPGQDFSQQNSPQVTYTDLTIGGTTTQVTSAANPFATCTSGVGFCGNIIHVTGGAGCTVGWYQVVSTSTITATLDRAVGTAASVCTGNLGGSLQTIQQANTNATSGNTINVMTGTYPFTSAMPLTQATVTISGYQTTHGDNGTKPLLTTSTNSTNLITSNSTGGVQTFDNLSLSNTATTRASGIIQLSPSSATQTWIVRGCLFDGFTIAVDSSNLINNSIGLVQIVSSEIKNSGTDAVGTGTAPAQIFGSYIHDNPGNGILIKGTTVVTSTIIVNNGGSGIIATSASFTLIVSSSTIANNTGTGIRWDSASGTPGSALLLYNNVIYGNAIGVNSFTFPWGVSAGRNNAFQNTSGNTNWPGSPGDIALTANPFTNSAAGDYSLNSTAGGGALLKGAGFPGTFPAGLSTGHLDIGAVQSAGTGTTILNNFGQSN